MNDFSAIDGFLNTFITYIDSGFGLISGDVTSLAAILIVIDVTLAALFWAWGQNTDIIQSLVKKTLYVGAFAFIFGNFLLLANTVFFSFAMLGLDAAASGLDASDLMKPGLIAAEVNAGQSGLAGGIIVIAALVAAILLTRVSLAPLKPFFRIIRAENDKNPPVIGRTGIVRTATVDERGGQVEIENQEAPLLLNARLASGSAPLSRNTEVIVISHDPESGIYTVRSLSESIPPQHT